MCMFTELITTEHVNVIMHVQNNRMLDTAFFWHQSVDENHIRDVINIGYRLRFMVIWKNKIVFHLTNCSKKKLRKYRNLHHFTFPQKIFPCDHYMQGDRAYPDNNNSSRSLFIAAQTKAFLRPFCLSHCRPYLPCSFYHILWYIKIKMVRSVVSR